jgi:hypothetical protein
MAATFQTSRRKAINNCILNRSCLRFAPLSTLDMRNRSTSMGRNSAQNP